MMKQCSVDACEDVARTWGLCVKHYSRKKRYGSTDVVKRIRKYDSLCSVDGCTDKPLAQNMCSLHYNRVRVGVDLDAPKRNVKSGRTHTVKPSNDLGDGYRKCDDCGEGKPNEEFYQHLVTKSFERVCRLCKKKRSRLSHVLRNYGEEGVAFEERLIAGEGCEICGEHVPNLMAIDHDHNTGKPVGILCRVHNAAIGQLGDSEEMLLKALEYIRRTR